MLSLGVTINLIALFAELTLKSIQIINLVHAICSLYPYMYLITESETQAKTCELPRGTEQKTDRQVQRKHQQEWDFCSVFLQQHNLSVDKWLNFTQTHIYLKKKKGEEKELMSDVPF